MVGAGIGMVGGFVGIPLTWGASAVGGAALAYVSIHQFNENDKLPYFLVDGVVAYDMSHDEFVKMLKKTLHGSLAHCYVNGMPLSSKASN